MDYKEKYEKALQKIRELIEIGKRDRLTIIFYEKNFEEIFPELRESEDERIRKRIIQAIKIREKEMNEEWSDEIAWLEKQGEKNPADWSEKDEETLEYIKEAVINTWGGDTQDIILDWIESLKQRIGG